MPREVFVAGQVLTAAELNVVSDQTVMTFAGTAARGSAIPTPTEGMISYLQDTNQWEGYTTAWGPLGRILQVVQATKIDTFSTTSTSYVDVTGFSASITPLATSSKILVITNLMLGNNTSIGGQTVGQILRDSTAIGNTADGQSIWHETPTEGSRLLSSYQVLILDSPATTSAITYKAQIKAGTGSTAYVNRNTTSTRSAASSITLLEVAG